jgi:hypothetical protein
VNARDPAPAGDASAARRWTLAGIGFVALLAIPVAWTIWPPRVAGGFSDAVEYLLLADHYAQLLFDRAIYDPAGTAGYAGRTRLPPLYPLVLALVGGGASAVQASLLATGAMLVLAAFALWRAFAAERDGRDALLLLAAATLAFGFLTLALEPQSEPLFVAMTAAGLALATRARAPDAAGALWPAAILLALLPLVRTIGIAWVFGFIVLVALRRDLPALRRVVLAALCVAPTAAWMLLRRSGGGQSYAGALTLDALAAEFGGLDGWLLGLPGRFAEALASYWSPSAGPLSTAAALVLGLLALAGWLARARRGRLDAYAAPAYLGILAVWPFTEELARLLAPLVPFVVLAAVEGAEWLVASRARLRGAVAPVLAGLLLVAATPALLRAASRALDPVPDRLAPFKRDAGYLATASRADARRGLAVAAGVFDLTGSLREHVPPGACVYTNMPYQTLLYGGVAAIDLPYVLDFERPVAQQLAACRYVLATARDTSQHRYSGIALHRALERDARVVAVARLDAPSPGSTTLEVAGVLLEIPPAPAP